MSALETAVLYLRQGFAVVPVPHKSKRPVGDRWQNMRITEPLASRHFNGESQNIGALLGAPSAGLTDGDLDSQEAIIAAPYLMPRTGAVFGRASKRFSHRLYKTTLAESQGKAAIQFKDTQKPPKVILELRIGANASGEHAAQTIFPGSVHPSGELIAWDEHGEPSVADDAMLLAAAARVAACVLLARAYPQQGGRHEGALIVAGFLARCGFTLADTKLFVEALAAVTMQPPDKRRDMIKTAGDTAEAFAAGRNTFGLPKLKECFGEAVAKKCVEWVGYRAEARGANSERAAAALVNGEQWTELGNAHRFVFQHGADIRYVHPLKSWFIWGGIFWRRDDDAEIMRRAEATIESLFDESKLIADDATRQAFRKFALKSQARAQISAMVQLAQHNLKVVLSPDDMDSDPMLLGVLNGTIDLTTGKFRDGRREDYITKQCAVFFDPDAQCPEWLNFQRKVAGDNAELIAYKQRLFGLLLTGEMVEILFILHGGGQNGKSTEFETISGLLGGYAHAADAQVLLSQKERAGATPEIVSVKGKRAVFINETGESDHLNESRVKYLCGNDTMSGRNLYEGIINFRPTHKTLLRTNHKPKIRGTDLGIWRRINYVPYHVTIKDEEKVEKFRETKLEPERAGILN